MGAHDDAMADVGRLPGRVRTPVGARRTADFPWRESRHWRWAQERQGMGTGRMAGGALRRAAPIQRAAAPPARISDRAESD